MLRIVVILFLCFIVINLFIGLFHIMRGNSKDGRALRALTIRVACSIVLFAIILVATYFTTGNA